MNVLRAIKQRVLDNDVRPRTLLFGAFRGVRLHINPANATQLWLGMSEREVHRALRKLSTGVKAGVDIGAAEGEYAIYMLKRTDAERVLAVEPLSDEREMFARNVALNDIRDANKRLTVIPASIGSVEWKRDMTLDALLDSLPRPLFVKIDADGSEVDILQSAPRALADKQIRWLIETHRPDLESACTMDVHRIINSRQDAKTPRPRGARYFRRPKQNKSPLFASSR